MKFIVSIGLIALLSFAACMYFPWWSIAIVAFIVAALIPQGGGLTFISGFVSLFFLWALMSFWISSSNGHILAHKMSMVILQVDNPYLLMVLTGLVGGVVAGFAALTGSLLRKKKTVAS